MKKGFIFLMFLSLLVSSCAGTKYKNQATTTTKEYIPINNSDSSEEYTAYIEDFDFEFDLDFEFEFDLPKIEKMSDTSGLAHHIINTASDNLGVRYKYGGMNKSGMDCSGLVYTSFKTHDIILPRSSFEMAQTSNKIKDSEAQKGDLIFFTTNGSKRINHVGIVTEVLDNEIKFIHASTKLGVIISSTKEPYYQRSYVKVARVL